MSSGCYIWHTLHARLQPTSAEIQKHLALLKETPRRIAKATSGLDVVRLSQSPGARQWSVTEILTHLRACEEIWSFSIYMMLAENNPLFPLLDERRWAKAMHYATLEFRKSFGTFVLRREELLRVLRDLPQESWSRTAVIEDRTHACSAKHGVWRCTRQSIARRLKPL